MQHRTGQVGRRRSAIDHLYSALAHLVRRRSELGGEMHPELSLVGFTFLAEIEAAPGSRAADLATLFGLDKSTVSRQLNQLEAAGLLRREGERPGRRGYSLVVTTQGRIALEREATRARERLAQALAPWKATEINELADLLDRFIGALR